jgi:hypothetical protein
MSLVRRLTPAALPLILLVVNTVLPVLQFY